MREVAAAVGDAADVSSHDRQARDAAREIGVGIERRRDVGERADGDELEVGGGAEQSQQSFGGRLRGDRPDPRRRREFPRPRGRTRRNSLPPERGVSHPACTGMSSRPASRSSFFEIRARSRVSRETCVTATSSISGAASASARQSASSTSVPMSVSRTMRRTMSAHADTKPVPPATDSAKGANTRLLALLRRYVLARMAEVLRRHGRDAVRDLRRREHVQPPQVAVAIFQRLDLGRSIALRIVEPSRPVGKVRTTRPLPSSPSAPDSRRSRRRACSRPPRRASLRRSAAGRATRGSARPGARAPRARPFWPTRRSRA